MLSVWIYCWKDGRLHRKVIGHLGELLLERYRAHDKRFTCAHGWKDETRPAHITPSCVKQHLSNTASLLGFY